MGNPGVTSAAKGDTECSCRAGGRVGDHCGSHRDKSPSIPQKMTGTNRSQAIDEDEVKRRKLLHPSLMFYFNHGNRLPGNVYDCV